ncbi:small G protein signaling modulator 3-like isoform X1 [Artemia franciscana]|uniref:small G protein signaling modulator 3-like isoform X1 n=1 Tax=Artemia franciscana TaxID=6661 RepID=UPI0032DB2B43
MNRPLFCRIDEFGFILDTDEEEVEYNESNKKILMPDPQLTLKWIAFLEFQNDSEIQWLHMTERLRRSEKLEAMLEAGLPHILRSHVWMRLSGASERKADSEISYKEIVKLSNNDSTMASRQIEKDLLRTLPTNFCFGSDNSPGAQRLRRVLRSIAYMFPDIGYCQGMGTVASCLLLVLEEEDAFWIMCSILEEYLPASYYSTSLLGVQADQRVLRDLVAVHLPSLHTVLKEHDIELSLVTVNWYLTIFSSVLPFRQLLLLWDNFFLYGSIVMFKLSLMLLRSQEEFLRARQNSGDIFSAVSNLVNSTENPYDLLKVADKTLKLDETAVEIERRRYIAHLLSEQGALVGNPEKISTFPKERLSRRKFRNAKSNFQNFIFGKDLDSEDLRTKNVKTTEILVNLREAILQIGRHFLTDEPNLAKTSLMPDFSLDSHSKDIEVFSTVSRCKSRRAKALVDFERTEEDELGFKRNDIITIVSRKDEHCWVGELNGLRGWFPAKFVQLLDERSKQYCKAGDDSVSEKIADFVRGCLCPAVKQVLEYGLKKPNILGTPCHPWLFLEEAAVCQVEKDFNSVYSRLVLCKTFRLDEDGKVLTPEEESFVELLPWAKKDGFCLFLSQSL